MQRTDLQQMKEAKTQEERMSKVPLVLGESVQPVRGWPVPKTLCGSVSAMTSGRAMLMLSWL